SPADRARRSPAPRPGRPPAAVTAVPRVPALPLRPGRSAPGPWRLRRVRGFAPDRECEFGVACEAAEGEVGRPLVARLVVPVPAPLERLPLGAVDAVPRLARDQEDRRHTASQERPVIGVRASGRWRHLPPPRGRDAPG